MYAVDSAAVLQHWNFLTPQCWILMSLLLLFIADVMNIVKLLTASTLFGSTHTWEGEIVKWCHHVSCG